MILHMLKAELGYCTECQMAKVVGRFQVPGWKHEFFLCRYCLEQKGKEIDEVFEQANHARRGMEAEGAKNP